MDANGSDALFEIIQKELNKIIEHGDKKENFPQIPERPSKKEQTNSKDSESKHKLSNNTPNTPSSEINSFVRLSAGGSPSKDQLVPSSNEMDGKLSEMSQKFKTTLKDDIKSQVAAFDSPRARSIDADLQRMQMELQDSYNMFQSISEKFETIDFSSLQKRIKDLNLTVKRDTVGRERSDELKRAIDEGFKENRLNELTNEMGEKFRNHTGEFGNIPELSSFFQACTQLDHVLSGLMRQRADVRALEERMRRSAELSYNRVHHIKQQLINDKRE